VTVPAPQLPGAKPASPFAAKGTATRRSLLGRGEALAAAPAQVRLLELRSAGAAFPAALERAGLPPLRAGQLGVLQLNLGKRCNQTCSHCHVDAGPDRTETMGDDVIERALAVLAGARVPALDITGGAPELHPRFRDLVVRARAAGASVMDRCNLTVLGTPVGVGLAEFLAEHRVAVVASLPHPRALLTDRQRGAGVFEGSLRGLERLNAVGYGRGQGLFLALVANPVGRYLPGDQAGLEREWRRELTDRLGLHFDSLWAMANMPIGRFLHSLETGGHTARYLEDLARAFNPAAVQALMCRTTLSVAWDGSLHDCDFNQMLELGLAPTAPRTIFDIDPGALRPGEPITGLDGRDILQGPHCFACTAGSGSSCGGQLAP
jgi:radical SAM/Cys-rich protein